MYCAEFHLKDYFPFLGEKEKDPYLTVYLPYDKILPTEVLEKIIKESFYKKQNGNL